MTTAKSSSKNTPTGKSSPTPTNSSSTPKKKNEIQNHSQIVKKSETTPEANKNGNNTVATASTSSASSSSSRAVDLGTRHDYIHSIMMVMLYISQGMVQGSNAACATFLIQHKSDLSISDQSLLTLPVYAFSFKFLWAPFVDCVYVSKNSRRPLWIISCQVLICLYSLGIQMFWASHLRDDVGVLVVVMCLMSFTVATQDIAVDSWAIEGISERRSDWAGTAQTVGLMVGWNLTQSFFILQEWGFVATETGASSLFSVLFWVQFFTLVLVVFYRFGTVSCQVTFAESDRRDLKMLNEKKKQQQQQQQPKNKQGGQIRQTENQLISSPSSSSSAIIIVEETATHALLEVFRDIKKIAKQFWFVDVCLVILLRGVQNAAGGLVGTQMMKKYGITPAFSSSLSLALLPLTFLVAAVAPVISAFCKKSKLTAPWSKTSLDFWWFVTCIGFVVEGFSNLAFTFMASDSAEFRMWYVIPADVVSVFTHTLSYFTLASVYSGIARKVHHSTGTAVTLMNSMSNFGAKWPSTVALLIGGQIASRMAFFSSSEKFEKSESFGGGDDNNSSSTSMPTSSKDEGGISLTLTNWMLWTTFLLGVFLHFTVIRGAIKRLSLVFDNSNENEAQEKSKSKKRKNE